MRNAALLSVLASVFVGCAPAPSDEGPTDDVVTLDDKADRAAMSAKVGQLTVTIKPELTVTPVGAGFRYTFSGTTNRDLDAVQSFVPDDVFGEALLTGKRSFTVSLNDDYELNSVLSGLRLLVSFTVHGSKTSYTAGVKIAPRLAARSGPSQISVDATMTPIFWGGRLDYRGKLHLTVTPTTVNAWTDADIGPRVASVSARVYTHDWSYEGLKAGLTAGPMHFSIVDGNGKAYFRDATVSLLVNELALTTLDPYDHWPQPTCAASVQKCLDKLPYGGYDTASCGAYDSVRRCTITQVLPSILPGDSGSEIPSLVDAANQSLPSGHVGAAMYRYDWASVTPPSINQILDGWVAFDRETSAKVGGALDRPALDTALAKWHLDGLLTALKNLVFIDRFVAGTVTDGTTTRYLIQVPEAADLLVVDTTP